MNSDTMLSFVNGVIAGAGAVLAIMSAAFLQFVSPLENVQGVTTTEIRVAILLGGIVCAVAVGYEFYRKKEAKKTKQVDEEKPDRVEEKSQTQQNDEGIHE